MMVLVDTSIWSLALRRKRHDLADAQLQQVRRLQDIIAEGRARLLGPVRQELLSGIRSSQQFTRLQEQLRSFPDAALETADYESAAEISNACRGRGIAGTPIDFLLCAAALRRSWAVYTADRDFERYAKYIPLTLFQ